VDEAFLVDLGGRGDEREGPGPEEGDDIREGEDVLGLLLEGLLARDGGPTVAVAVTGSNTVRLGAS
jgi:hypothetical protein